MGIFSNLFKRNKKTNEQSKTDYSDVALFLSKYEELLSQNKYLARSEFNFLKEQNKGVYEKYKILSENDNKVAFDLGVKDFLGKYQDLTNDYAIIKKHNDDYISKQLKTERKYFDRILKDIDSNVLLDEEQRRACLDDEDYELIIAGAGAGKTTTLAAKVKYLIEKKKVNPQDILVIAFTNKAVNELKDKIQNKMSYKVPISTFHSCGRAIMKKDDEYEDTDVCSGSYFFIREYINDLITRQPALLSKMVLLFAYYLDITEDIINRISEERHIEQLDRSNYTTINYYLNCIVEDNITHNKTICNEVMRSAEEVQIANFLYLNSIEYKYEDRYPHPIRNSNKPYTPDFHIFQGGRESYIEHFGITQSGNNSRYTPEQLKTYKNHMIDKIQLHQYYRTDLICTYSSYNDGRSLLEHLKEELIKKGYILNRRSDREVYQQLTESSESKYVSRFANLATRFINLFKSEGFNESRFSSLISQYKDNPRNSIFLEIMQCVYTAYQHDLKEKKLVDFADMINCPVDLLKEVESVREKIKFKYIIIDEYQDISRSRFNLVDALRKVTDAKICAVGDDWQAIYGYAGSNINLFTKFEEQLGYASVLKITRTYRNSQELINVAGGFIKKNPEQIQKDLISSKSLDKPIQIKTYDASRKTIDNPGANYNKSKLLEETIGEIIQKDNNSKNILVIGRYGFDGTQLIDSGLFYTNTNKYSNSFILHSKQYPKVKITFMTAHATKGLTYDIVIIINASNSKYGFPAQIDDDPLLQIVRHIDRSYENSEERRLFYVALTRTKNFVYILAPGQNPSTFVTELLNDYSNYIALDESKIGLNYDVELLNKNKERCPVCHYPLLKLTNTTYAHYTLPVLYVCTNEPEICDYITNDLRSGEESIYCCKKCGQGLMIVKENKTDHNPFFACTEYNSKIKCDNRRSIKKEGVANEKEN